MKARVSTDRIRACNIRQIQSADWQCFMFLLTATNARYVHSQTLCVKKCCRYFCLHGLLHDTASATALAVHTSLFSWPEGLQQIVIELCALMSESRNVSTYSLIFLPTVMCLQQYLYACSTVFSLMLIHGRKANKVQIGGGMVFCSDCVLFVL